MTDGIAMRPETKRYVTRTALSIRWLMGFISLIIALALFSEWSTGRSAGETDPSLLVWAIIVCTAGVWELLSALRAGLWINENGITVRGSIRTQRFAWSEITSFTMDGFAGLAAKHLRVHLRNGDAVKVKTILEPRFGPKYKTSIVQELNEALAGATMPVRPDAH